MPAFFHIMERWKKITIWSLAGVIFSIIIDALILEHLLFSVKKFKIGNAGKRKIITILHLTDLHFRKTVGLKYRLLVRKINKLNPDIIFISGDSIDQTGTIAPLEKFLRLLDSQIPKAAILGNHEYAAHIDLEKLQASYRKVNCDLLINETKIYFIKGERVAVTGLDDLLQGDENFYEAVKNVGHEVHHFVLIHSPKHQEKIIPQIKNINEHRDDKEKLNIYAFFAGHNHGGQIRLGGIVPHLPPESGGYIEGWYNTEKPFLYLSRGFGTSVVPIRFWARSEITIFEYSV